MDQEKGAILAWMSIIFFNRDAKNHREPKLWLLDVPALSRIFQDSSHFLWSDDCYEDFTHLGNAAGYTFETFLAQLNVPFEPSGSCFACPINVDATFGNTSAGAARTEQGNPEPITPPQCQPFQGEDVDMEEVPGTDVNPDATEVVAEGNVRSPPLTHTDGDSEGVGAGLASSKAGEDRQMSSEPYVLENPFARGYGPVIQASGPSFGSPPPSEDLPNQSHRRRGVWRQWGGGGGSENSSSEDFHSHCAHY
ncbi:hypothetical protein KC19_VG088700 [Ceratodon purpureus]|uniref:Uncharacterized protein n=1 Tax=Ceratodon purpureus TaxID=3225 RepID=A0A8T0HNE0_CERPU|nr:hypothetical protein KC19_VG088700 [Ceratodon purpureus]